MTKHPTTKPGHKNRVTNASIRNIEKQILMIRGEKVLLDADLAALYEV